MRTELVYQSQRQGCGYACVKMALIHSSSRRDFAYAAEKLITGQAPSFADLIAYGRSYGLKLSGYKVWDSREVLANRNLYPFIATIREDGFSHAVYVVKKVRDDVVFFDPSAGKRRLSASAFASLFEGYVLIEEGYEEVSQPIRRRNPVAALSQFSGTLVSIFPSFLLLSGLLLLSFIPELGFWSIGFFLGSLLASMGGRLYLSSRLKRFDDHYLDGVDDGDASLRKERYAHYHAYKAAVFSTAPQLLSSLFELMAAFSFLAFADLQLGLSIAILILLLCLKHLLTRPSLDKKRRRIERLEKAFLSEAPTDRKAILRSLGEESESFSFAFLIDHAFGSFLALCLACLSLLPSSFSAERFLFVGMSLLFVSSLVEKCFDSAKKLREKKAEEGYFRLHFMD